MALAFDDYITIISLGISFVSLTVVIFLWDSVRRLSVEQHHNSQSSPGTLDDRTVEVSAIVSEFSQRLRKLEESLVDQKVKMEILELRASRFAPRTFESQTGDSPVGYGPPNPVENPGRPSIQDQGVLSGVRNLAPQKGRPEPEKKLGVTEIEALRLVFEGRGKISAKEIQQRIGRTREHTARMMNSLYHDGLVERDVAARPFSYSITEKGRDILNG
jgi:hypothetical protein